MSQTFKVTYSLTVRILNLECQGSIGYLYFFLTIKSLIQIYFLKLCSFATPIPIHCMSYRILSLLSLFSDNPHIDVCGLLPQALPFDWADLGPQFTCLSLLTLTRLVFVSSFTLLSFPLLT